MVFDPSGFVRSDAGATMDSGVARDAGPRHDAGEDSDSGADPDAGSATRTGSTLGLLQNGTQFVLSASFVDAPPPDPCTTLETAGDCEAFRCEVVDGTSLDAGNITASASGSPLLSAFFDPMGYRAVENLRMVNPGDPIDIANRGATVPRFVASGTMPEAPTVTFPFGSTLSRTARPRLTWSSSVRADTVEITLFRVLTFVRCTVPASQGEVTIEPALMSHLSTGAGGQFNVRGLRTFTTDAGPYRIDVSLAAAGPGEVVTLE